MSLCLTFGSLEAAETAERVIWINRVKQVAASGIDLVGDGTTHYSDLSGLTDDQISQLKVYSYRNGNSSPDPSLTGTLRYAEPKKAFEIDLWYFSKPDESLMNGVVGHTTQEYNADWEEPIDEL